MVLELDYLDLIVIGLLIVGVAGSFSGIYAMLKELNKRLLELKKGNEELKKDNEATRKAVSSAMDSHGDNDIKILKDYNLVCQNPDLKSDAARADAIGVSLRKLGRIKKKYGLSKKREKKT